MVVTMTHLKELKLNKANIFTTNNEAVLPCGEQ